MCKPTEVWDWVGGADAMPTAEYSASLLGCHQTGSAVTHNSRLWVQATPPTQNRGQKSETEKRKTWKWNKKKVKKSETQKKQKNEAVKKRFESENMKCETMWKYKSLKWKLITYSKSFQNFIEILVNLKKNGYTYFFCELFFKFSTKISFFNHIYIFRINKTFGPDLAPYTAAYHGYSSL